MSKGLLGKENVQKRKLKSKLRKRLAETFKRAIKGGEELINILYPPVCPFCERQLLRTGVCQECLSNLPFVEGNRCMKCSKPVYSEEIEFCMDCARVKHSYEEGRALFIYNALVQRSLAGFKYKNKREFSVIYSRLMIQKMGELWKSWDCEAVIPVPIHAIKKQKRGFNQAELVAKAIGAYLRVPCDTKVIYRCINTLPQKEFSSSERRKNLEKAFKIKQNSVEYKKVLLIDDIYTTGSTVDACADVLRQAGVQKVYFSSISIGLGI